MAARGEVEAILQRMDEHIRGLQDLRERMSVMVGVTDASAEADLRVGWIRRPELDRNNFTYPWPDATKDRIAELQAWQSPEELGGALFAIGEADEAVPTFGRPRRYIGVYVIGAEGGSHRHVVNFSEGDRGQWVSLIRGKGASKRGYHAADEPLPYGYDQIPTGVHAEQVDGGWNRACVAADHDDRQVMLIHAALQARDREIGPMGT